MSARTTAPEQRELLFEEAPPVSVVAKGLAGGVAPLAELVERDHPHRATGLDETLSRWLEVLRWTDEPGIAEVRARGGETEVDGPHLPDEHGWFVLDSREEPVRLRFVAEERRVELELDRGHLRVYELRSPLRAFTLPPASNAPVPLAELDAWLDDEPIEPWLREGVVGRLDEPDVFDVSVAAGMVLRLHLPATREARAALAAKVLSGAPDAVSRVRAWVRGVVPTTWEEAEDAAVHVASDLQDRFACLEETLGTELDDGVLTGLVRERDALESARAVLRVAGRGERLEAALAALDREACLHFACFEGWRGMSSSPWLDAVAWREPEAWWGRLAK